MCERKWDEKLGNGTAVKSSEFVCEVWEEGKILEK